MKKKETEQLSNKRHFLLQIVIDTLMCKLHLNELDLLADFRAFISQYLLFCPFSQFLHLAQTYDVQALLLVLCNRRRKKEFGKSPLRRAFIQCVQT